MSGVQHIGTALRPLSPKLSTFSATMATLYVATVAGLKGQPGQPRSRITLPLSLPGGTPATALYDAGAAVSTVHEKIFRKIPIDKRPKKLDVPIILGCENGSPIAVKGCYLYELKILD